MTPHFPAAVVLLERARVKNTFLDFRDEVEKDAVKGLGFRTRLQIYLCLCLFMVASAQ